MKIVVRGPAVIALSAALGIGLGGPPPAAAEPPPWAPAWGYRAKQGGPPGHAKHKHKGRYQDDYREDRRPVDYVSPYLEAGSCNREAIGRAVGGVVGGAAGSQIGKGDGRTAAMIVGTIAGYLLGGHIGRSMDEADQACVGQALEYVPRGQTVSWRNPDTAARYRVTPGETYQSGGTYCREFTRQVMVGGDTETLRGTACRGSDGVWRVQS